MLNLIRTKVGTGVSKQEDVCVVTNKHISALLYCLGGKNSYRTLTVTQKGRVINGID